MAVMTGLDHLVAEDFARLKGKRIALLGHPASVDRSLKHLLDLCIEAELDIVRLFGPEHGLRGDAQDMEHVDGHVDPRTGLDVVSLYGATRDTLLLKPDLLDDVDVLVCDLQDVGSRYYTFSYTIAFAMRACAQSGTTCLVLDRPNPIDAVHVEGNVVQPGWDSFVGEYPLMNRHGLTMGELCHAFAAFDTEKGLPACDLQVLWMTGYSRSMRFDETGLPWVYPSPNMPTLDTAIVYPGGCLFEGTNLSEGRGTTRPFELVGAPYITDADAFAAAINASGLPGIVARPCAFKPMFQKQAEQLCGGVQLHITDAGAVDAMRTGVAVIRAAMAFEGFDWRREPYEFVSDRLAMDLLFGHDAPRLALEDGASVDDVMLILQSQRDDHLARREAWLHPAY